jgi:primosomal protein N'
LVPEGPRATPRIKGGQDDAVLNPALPLRLNEFGITLPTYEEVEGLTVSEILTRFTAELAKAKDFKEWSLEPEVHLATFSFAKEAMYKDLLDNEATIIDHPVIQALANSDPTSQSDEFQFDPVDPADIDEVAPPERTPLVLDADSSQRAAVVAALGGRSFVMDGPPGTGKSQTIANMIGALMHAGKSVLFVSEKIAALDVVKNRLKDSGLESYLLELHSHKTNRKDVASELLRTLENVAQPPHGMPPLAQPLRTAVADLTRTRWR